MYRIIKLIKSQMKNLFLKRRNIKISFLAFYDDLCKFEKNIYVDRFCILHQVSLKSYSYIGYGSSINNCNIGKFCSIGPDVKIGLGIHPLNMVSTSPIFYSNNNCLGTEWIKTHTLTESKQTLIGNDVWIGANVIIMGGIQIGDGAVIAAGAIVTKDVEPYSIVAGVPAKKIRTRIPLEDIDVLSNIKWWDWNEKILKERAIEFSDPATFIQKFRD